LSGNYQKKTTERSVKIERTSAENWMIHVNLERIKTQGK